jgi:outer membrane protein assembly factor BamB
MSAAFFLLSLSSLGLITGVEITFPADDGAYNSPDLDVRAVLDYENLLADSVRYSLNGSAWIGIPRLDTDWYTYMQNGLHHGYSESPAPHDASVLWTAPICNTYHEFPNPVVVDGIVYYPVDGLGLDSIFALDPLTGETIWTCHFAGSDDAATVVDGLVYVASDSLYCLDALDGERVWVSSLADVDGSTPSVDGGWVYAGTSRDISPRMSSISRFDAYTGAVDWTSVIDGVSTVSCLTVWEGMVFVPTYNGGISPIYALDAATGETLWFTPVDGGFWDSSPVVVDSVIYIGSDGPAGLLAIDCLDGGIIWSTPLGNAITATPAFHDGSLFIGTEGNGPNGVFVRVDAPTGGIQWTAAYSIHGSPCVADGLVFFGETLAGADARVVALDCATGETVWTYPVEAEIFMSTPAVTDGIMYISAIDGNLYAFGTGYKFSYDAPMTAQIGWNELIVKAFCPGGTILADTVSFLVDPYGIEEGQPAVPSAPVLRVIGNPAGDCTSLVLLSPSPATALVRVFDLSGRVVIGCEIPEGPDRSIELNVSGFPPGIYSIRWEQDGVCGTASLVVLR